MTTVEMMTCQHLRDLDKQFRTKRRSPLHHDNRCPLHRKDK